MGRPLRARYLTAGFNSLSGVSNTTEYITTTSPHVISNGDVVTYVTATGNTAIPGLANASSYYAVNANTTALQLSLTLGGAAINITAGTSETGHSLYRGAIDGVQEMTDTEINDLIAPLILSYIVNNPNTSYGTSLRLTQGAYGVSRGTAVRSGTQAVGTHPATLSSLASYTLYQTELQQSLTTLNVVRPVQYTISGQETKISEMSDSTILSDFIPSVVQTMITGGQGAYYLGLTASGSPAGTWSSYATMDDTYYNSSGVFTTDQYTLWQKASGTTAGIIRPLKYVVDGTSVQLKEMTNADIETLAAAIGEYIRTTSIGQYAFAQNAPGAGTWSSRGAFITQANNLVDTAYVGNYADTYTGVYAGTYVGAFSAPYAGTYVGAFSAPYAGTYVGAFSAPYAGTYVGAFTSIYAGTYVGAFTSIYAGGYIGYFTGSYTGLYSRNWTGSYTGSYSRDWTGSYTGLYSRNWTGDYSRPYVGSYDGSFAGTYVGSYAGTYEHPTGYASNWSRPYVGSRDSGTFQQIVSKYFSRGPYVRSFTHSFTGAYSRERGVVYSGERGKYYNVSYAGVYTQNVGTLVYTSTWTRHYSGSYSRIFTGSYTKEWTGPHSYSGSRTKNLSSYTGATFTPSFLGPGYYSPGDGQYGINWTRIRDVAYTGTYVGSYAGTYQRTIYYGGVLTAHPEYYTGLSNDRTFYGGKQLTSVFSGSYFTGSYVTSTEKSYTQGYTGLYTGGPYTGANQLWTTTALSGYGGNTTTYTWFGGNRLNNQTAILKYVVGLPLTAAQQLFIDLARTFQYVGVEGPLAPPGRRYGNIKQGQANGGDITTSDSTIFGAISVYDRNSGFFSTGELFRLDLFLEYVRAQSQGSIDTLVGAGLLTATVTASTSQWTATYTIDSGTYAGSYSGEKVFTGNWSREKAVSFTGDAPGYAQTYQLGYTANLWTGSRTKSWLRYYAGTYTAVYTGIYGAYTSAGGLYYTPITALGQGSYATAYIGYYVGVISYNVLKQYANFWSRTYAGSYVGYYTKEYSRPYSGSYSRNWTGSYSGTYSRDWTGIYAGTYVGSYAGNFAGTYVGSYAGAYAGTYVGSYAGAYLGAFNQTFSGNYTGIYSRNFTGSYTGIYSRNFTGSYTGIYSRNFTGSYTGIYSRNFTGSYTGAYTHIWTGSYSGLTVINTTASTQFTLWVRTA